MMTKYKIWIVTILLLITAAFTFAIPRAKYTNKVSLSDLFQIPLEISGWQGRDVSNSLEINLEEARFGFISDALAYEYISDNGEKLIFIILDAGNFHHPKNCFISSGYQIKDLPDNEFLLQDRTVKAHTLFTKREKDSFLSFYWIVINKNIVHEWVEQKFKQLYFSLFNQKRVGLMMRIDIPTNENNIKDANALANDFLDDLRKSFLSSDSDYIFGEK